MFVLKMMFLDFQLREYNGSLNGANGNGTYEPLPEITVCSLDTVLVWVPCGFLLLISPFYLYHLLGLKTRGAATWLNISKTVSYFLFSALESQLEWSLLSVP